MASVDKENEESLYDKYIEGNRCVIVNGVDMVRCYFDKLRDMRVLTYDDIEEIVNKQPTRRLKAGHFLDILQTKGSHGVKCFMNILEFQNPEIFQTVAKRKPRPPPPGFVKSIDPLDLHLLDKIPETIRVLHDEVKGNTDLRLRVQELEQCLKANQNDKDELQVENDRLRIENISLKAEKEEVAKKCGDLVKQNVTLREQSMEYLKDSLEFSRDRDLQREKCTAALTQKNELERQVIELQEMISQGQQAVCTCPQSSSASVDEPDNEQISLEKELERLAVEKQILKEELEEEHQNCEDIVCRMNDTSSQLHEAQSKCQELEKKVKTLTKERNTAQQTYQERKEKVETYFLKIQQLEEEKRTLEEERIQEQKKWHKESIDHMELFREKHNLENAYEELKMKYDLLVRRSMQISLPEHNVHLNGQQQNDVEFIPDIKYNTLPPNISGIPSYSSVPPNAGSALSHRRSQPLKRPQRGNGPQESFNSVQKVRPESGESVQVNVSYSMKQRGEAPRDSDIVEENCELDQSAVPYFVSTSIQGSDRGSIGVSSIDSFNKKDTTGETSDESSSTADDFELVQYEVVHNMVPRHPVFSTDSETEPFIVTLGTPSLTEQIEVTGGNFTGIFINKVLKKPAEQSLKVGDQILSVVKVYGSGERITKCFTYCTREEVYEVLDADSNIVSVELKCIRDPSAFKKVLQWMVDNNSCGDFFFMRSNFKLSGEEEEHPVQSGDVYCVLDTKSRPKYWRVSCYDRDVQAWKTEPVYIPNKNHALRSHRMKARQKSDSAEKTLSTPGRQGGIRCRSENYTRVLPVKAIRKSQVLLFGADEVVTIVQKMMAADQSKLPIEILGENVTTDILRQLPQDRTNVHILRKGSLTPTEKNQSIRIILYLCVRSTGNAEQLRAIFGDEFVLNEGRPDTKMEPCLQSLGLNYDVIHIPNDEICDRGSLVKFLQERISQKQNQIYWLGAQNLSYMDQEQYQFILGHQLQVKAERIQRSLSNSLRDDTQTQDSTKPSVTRSKSQF